MEKPILFNTEMVQAILEGKKTSTRRPIKPRPEHGIEGCPYSSTGFSGINENGGCRCSSEEYKPPYQVGDTLWVRETWCKIPNIRAFRVDIWFKADYKDGELDELIKEFPKAIKWHPSIHMPRAAARIFLKVTDIRVQKVQDITEEDALKEGIVPRDTYSGKRIFMNLWNNLYSNWAENPWVWVIEFERLEGLR